MKLSVVVSLFFLIPNCIAQAKDSPATMGFSLVLEKQDTSSKNYKPSIKTTDLKPVIIQSKLLQFQKDSLEARKLYHKVIGDAQRKPKVIITPIGIAVEGGFSRLAELISGKRKSDKKFLKTLQANERGDFIAIIYNPERIKLVNQIGDSMAALLMQKFPMPYDFARQASPLEVDMWIRNNYRIFEKEAANK